MSLAELKREIKNQSNVEHAKTMQWFFKTGKGEYGEGDIFVGIKVPVQRKIAKKFIELNYRVIRITAVLFVSGIMVFLRPFSQ